MPSMSGLELVWNNKVLHSKACSMAWQKHVNSGSGKVFADGMIMCQFALSTLTQQDTYGEHQGCPDDPGRRYKSSCQKHA